MLVRLAWSLNSQSPGTHSPKPAPGPVPHKHSTCSCLATYGSCRQPPLHGTLYMYCTLGAWDATSGHAMTRSCCCTNHNKGTHLLNPCSGYVNVCWLHSGLQECLCRPYPTTTSWPQANKTSIMKHAPIKHLTQRTMWHTYTPRGPAPTHWTRLGCRPCIQLCYQRDTLAAAPTAWWAPQYRCRRTPAAAAARSVPGLCAYLSCEANEHLLQRRVGHTPVQHGQAAGGAASHGGKHTAQGHLQKGKGSGSSRTVRRLVDKSDRGCWSARHHCTCDPRQLHACRTVSQGTLCRT